MNFWYFVKIVWDEMIRYNSFFFVIIFFHEIMHLVILKYVKDKLVQLRIIAPENL